MFTRVCSCGRMLEKVTPNDHVRVCIIRHQEFSVVGQELCFSSCCLPLRVLESPSLVSVCSPPRFVLFPRLCNWLGPAFRQPGLSLPPFPGHLQLQFAQCRPPTESPPFAQSPTRFCRISLTMFTTTRLTRILHSRLPDYASSILLAVDSKL